VAALAFGYWAFSGRQDYKNKSDTKVATAVVAAQKSQTAKDQAAYDQQSKQPYSSFVGPATYGTVSFNYPKTWNAYIDTTSSNEPINGYYYPGSVPGVSSGTAYALRVELLTTDYGSTVSALTASSSSTSSNLTATAYMPAKLNGVKNALPGTLLTGAIGQDNSGNSINGVMLVIPVRDKTLQISTQSQDFTADFNNVILPSLNFTP